MSDKASQCPCCGASDPKWLGALPDSEWFAGKRLTHRLNGGALYRCKTCFLKFRFPLEDPASYHTLYDNAETRTWPAQSRRIDWDLILEQISHFKPEGGKVLDFGCYSGGLLSRLDGRYERFGIEINREAARIAQEAAGAHLWNNLEAMPADQRFDVIVIADVLEHVPNPQTLFDHLKRNLGKDGIVVATTGDADNPLWNWFGANWWYCFYPEHVSFVSKKWVEQILLPNGWSLMTYKRFRYRRLSPFLGLVELASACMYGLFPRAYLHIQSVLKRSRALTSAPGNSVTADHLLITLARKRSS
ncbi:MAG TPA: class I SAM-dependent methyltransferase [Xanthomonadaceae bacterium]|nr:class I SAM-dependent methyltransferase [Xanthomonadaceae bacterium]